VAWKERTPEVALLDAAAGNAVRETSRFGRGISPQDGCEKSCIETIPCARCIDNSLYTEGGDKMVRRAQSRGALLSRRAFPQETAAVAEFDADDFGHHLRRLLDGIEDLSQVLDAGKRAGLVVTGDEVILPGFPVEAPVLYHERDPVGAGRDEGATSRWALQPGCEAAARAIKK